MGCTGLFQYAPGCQAYPDGSSAACPLRASRCSKRKGGGTASARRAEEEQGRGSPSRSRVEGRAGPREAGRLPSTVGGHTLERMRHMRGFRRGGSAVDVGNLFISDDGGGVGQLIINRSPSQGEKGDISAEEQFARRAELTLAADQRCARQGQRSSAAGKRSTNHSGARGRWEQARGRMMRGGECAVKRRRGSASPGYRDRQAMA